MLFVRVPRGGGRNFVFELCKRHVLLSRGATWKPILCHPSENDGFANDDGDSEANEDMPWAAPLEPPPRTKQGKA